MDTKTLLMLAAGFSAGVGTTIGGYQLKEGDNVVVYSEEQDLTTDAAQIDKLGLALSDSNKNVADLQSCRRQAANDGSGKTVYQAVCQFIGPIVDEKQTTESLSLSIKQSEAIDAALNNSDLPWESFTIREVQDGNGVKMFQAMIHFKGDRVAKSISDLPEGKLLTEAIRPVMQ